jgi:hypothetical protein
MSKVSPNRLRQDTGAESESDITAEAEVAEEERAAEVRFVAVEEAAGAAGCRAGDVPLTPSTAAISPLLSAAKQRRDTKG